MGFKFGILVSGPRSVLWFQDWVQGSQRAQYPLTKEYSLNHNMKPLIGLSGFRDSLRVVAGLLLEV